MFHCILVVNLKYAYEVVSFFHGWRTYTWKKTRFLHSTKTSFASLTRNNGLHFFHTLYTNRNHCREEKKMYALYNVQTRKTAMKKNRFFFICCVKTWTFLFSSRLCTNTNLFIFFTFVYKHEPFYFLHVCAQTRTAAVKKNSRKFWRLSLHLAKDLMLRKALF